MKVGVLTYHSEVNFGSVLQAYAVQETFKALGCDVEIIDRWMDCCNRYAKGPLLDLNFKNLLKVLLRSLYTIGEVPRILRYVKTCKFKQRYLNISSYSFYDWKDAPAHLDYDIVSVGSDQVWNANLFDPNDYLLAQLPSKIARMSYAASIGMNAIPEKLKPVYKSSLSQYVGVSVREKSAVALLSELGIQAEKVVDPTLVVDRDVWDEMIGYKSPKMVEKTLVVYVLAEKLECILPLVEDFCQRNNCRASVFVDYWVGGRTRSLRGVASAFKFRFRLARNKIKLCLSACPSDFVREIAYATWVITNSFHALMFSTIYRKDVRIIKPTDKVRLQMHSRMQEFEGTIIKGPLMQDSVASAMTSVENEGPIVYDGERLKSIVLATQQWMTETLRRVKS